MKPGFFDLILVQEDFYIIEAKSSVQHSQSHIECTKGKNRFLRTHDLSFSTVYFFIYMLKFNALILCGFGQWILINHVFYYSYIFCQTQINIWTVQQQLSQLRCTPDCFCDILAETEFRCQSPCSWSWISSLFKTGSKNTATINYGRIPESSPHHKNILCHSVGWSWHQIQQSRFGIGMQMRFTPIVSLSNGTLFDESVTVAVHEAKLVCQWRQTNRRSFTNNRWQLHSDLTVVPLMCHVL